MTQLPSLAVASAPQLGSAQFLHLNEAVSTILNNGRTLMALTALTAMRDHPTHIIAPHDLADPTAMLVCCAQSSRYHDLLAASPPLAHRIFRALHTIAALDERIANTRTPWSSLPNIDMEGAQRFDLRRVLNQIEGAQHLGNLYEAGAVFRDDVERANDRFHLTQHCIFGAFAVHAEIMLRKLQGIPVHEETAWWHSVMQAITPLFS